MEIIKSNNYFNRDDGLKHFCIFFTITEKYFINKICNKAYRGVTTKICFKGSKHEQSIKHETIILPVDTKFKFFYPSKLKLHLFLSRGAALSPKRGNMSLSFLFRFSIFDFSQSIIFNHLIFLVLKS